MTDTRFSRRNFLTLTWGAAGTVVLSELSLIGLRFLAPRPTDGEFGGIFNLGHADGYPSGSVTPVEQGRFYLVRLEDSGFLAIYRRCTHLGCAVPYNPAEGKFVCPCHGSAFTQDGEVLNQPAPRPLDLFTLSIDDEGNILVDTGQPIERDRSTPEHIVYA